MLLVLGKGHHYDGVSTCSGGDASRFKHRPDVRPGRNLKAGRRCCGCGHDLLWQLSSKCGSSAARRQWVLFANAMS